MSELQRIQTPVRPMQLLLSYSHALLMPHPPYFSNVIQKLNQSITMIYIVL